METKSGSHRAWFSLTATAVSAAALGFCAGRLLVPSGGSDDATHHPATASDQPGSSRKAPTSSPTGEHPPRQDEVDRTTGPGLGMRPPSSSEAEPERQAGRQALTRMLEQPGPISRWQDLMDFAQTATPDQISGALDELMNTPNSIDAVVARFFLYSRFGEGDPKAALAAIEGLPKGEIDLASQSVLGGWAGQDPQAAAAYLLAQADADGELNGANGRLVRNVVAEWSRRNPAEAFQWSLALKGEGRQTGIQTALRIWASSAPEAAAEAIADFPAGAERQDAYRTLAEYWSQAAPRATLDWASSLSEDVKPIVTATIIRNLANREPRLAAQMIGELEPGGDRDSAMRSAASSWADESPREAADWAWSQPDNDAKRKAVRDVVRKWAADDEGAASEWLNQQGAGPAKDSGIVALSNHVVADDPEAAAIWANTISDSSLRTLQVRSVILKWMKTDRDAALIWMQRSDFPESVRSELLQP